MEGADKERFNAIAEELSQLGTKFSNNVQDATKAFKKLVTDVADVQGLPPSALALAAQQVLPKTLILPSFHMLQSVPPLKLCGFPTGSPSIL